MFSVTTDVISFIQQSGEIIDKYYPEQVARLVICNAPGWFSSVWGLIAKVLPASVQKKIDILYDIKGLDKYIHSAMRSEAYGGTGVALGQAEGHLAFLQLAEEWSRNRNKPAALSIAVPTDKKQSSSNRASSNNSKETDSYSAVGDQLLNTSPRAARSSGGVMGWLKTRLGGGKGPTTPKTAFLGEKNSYRYNAASG